jgi:CBS domain-containing protein
MNQVEDGITKDPSTGESPVTRKTTNAFQYFYKNHSEVAVGIILSIILLLTFFLLQTIKPSVLALDWKWIVVSAIPLIIALIIGGYIKSFKGFGFELETTLKEPLSFIDLAAAIALSAIGQTEKGTMRDLLQMDDIPRRKVARLRFILSKRDYYAENVIEDYMDYLPNLEYFEIIRSNGSFVCLIPISIFRTRRENNYNEIRLFVEALQNGTILDRFKQILIGNSIKADINILDALQIMREKRYELAAVVNNDRIAIGVIRSSDIEHQIAAVVLNQARIKGLK